MAATPSPSIACCTERDRRQAAGFTLPGRLRPQPPSASPSSRPVGPSMKLAAHPVCCAALPRPGGLYQASSRTHRHNPSGGLRLSVRSPLRCSSPVALSVVMPCLVQADSSWVWDRRLFRHLPPPPWSLRGTRSGLADASISSRGRAKADLFSQVSVPPPNRHSDRRSRRLAVATN